MGYYFCEYLGPELKKANDWPPGVPAWEELLCLRKARHSLSIVGNLGLTAIAMAAAVVALLEPFHAPTAAPLLLLLALLAAFDYWVYAQPVSRFARPEPKTDAPGTAPAEGAN
jgi:hypothetical protein